MKRLTLSKTKKLTTSAQFKKVWARKIRFSDNLLIIYLAENDSQISRLGISINKSIGSAVTRNRLKRLLREAFRLNQNQIPPGFDYVFSFAPRPPKNLNFQTVSNSLMNLINTAFKKI